MRKQTEALNLALEAICGSGDFLFNWHDCEPNNEREMQQYQATLAANEKAFRVIREALAEQPAQQEPVAWKCECGANLYIGADGEPRSKSQQLQPMTWGVDWGKAGDIPCVSIIKRLPNGEIEVVAVEYAPYSYTSPPAQQQEPLACKDEMCACRNGPCASCPDGESEKELADVRDSRDFYKRRTDELQKAQSQMRDPERTMVCDILANGRLLAPAGGRYSTSPPASKPLDAGEISRLWKQHTNEDGPHHNPYDDDGLGFARAIEAAHGIKENT